MLMVPKSFILRATSGESKNSTPSSFTILSFSLGSSRTSSSLGPDHPIPFMFNLNDLPLFPLSFSMLFIVSRALSVILNISHPPFYVVNPALHNSSRSISN